MMTRSIAALFAFLSFGTVVLAAEPPPPTDQPATAVNAQDEKRAIVARTMELSPEMEQRFWPLYDEYQVQLNKLNYDRKAVITKLSVNLNALSDELAQELLNRTLDLEKKRLTLKKDLVTKFSKQFPAKVVARYYQIENKLDAMVMAAAAEKIPLVK